MTCGVKEVNEFSKKNCNITFYLYDQRTDNNLHHAELCKFKKNVECTSDFFYILYQNGIFTGRSEYAMHCYIKN